MATQRSKNFPDFWSYRISPKTCFKPGILERMQKVVELGPRQIYVKDHATEMFSFEETSTMNIRREVGIEETKRGSRVLYIIAFRKLVPIITLSCDEFLRAWWHVVLCRYFHFFWLSLLLINCIHRSLDSLQIQCTSQGCQSYQSQGLPDVTSGN
ncbi:hypothetical protein AZE42_13086 [Rhizopogon vesiculosus]|uniref:Uncharacterized protein n=1 Tax=Rhizopogon vesiculosus TaxID=180088 RepID=A0A1J8QF12_9AGAM|nr:hypothetical protein AZE42_13086 [Rhizopogon vesiculosus]